MVPLASYAMESTTMDTNQDGQFVVALRAAARDLTEHHSNQDIERTLEQIVTSAVATIPGVDAGSISMTGSRRIETRAPTNEVIGTLGAVQSELHEGPCISAIEDPAEDGTVVAQDLAGPDAGRWPRFAPHAVEAGYRALMSTQLSLEDIGATLNLYSATPDAYDAHARTLAGLFATQAAVILHGSRQAVLLQRTIDGLELAVGSRDMIGQAKGILMERFKVDDEAAFRMLVKASQATNTKVTTLALNLAKSVHEDPAATRIV